MAREDITIKTKDGECRTAVFTPGGSGAHPAVIFYMDGLGIRPTLYDMGERLAQAGYVVLLPDLFYRYGPYPPMDPKAVFASGDVRKALGPFFASTSKQRCAEDTGSFLTYLDTRSDVAGKKIGTTGYCMGGGMSLTAAGAFPDRVAAAASFHGGGMATDEPDSPHLQAPKIKAEVYVAGADKDDSYPPAMAARLEKALQDAGVKHRCEIYPDALHGWTMADFPIYNEQAAERHWRELTALYARTLK